MRRLAIALGALCFLVSQAYAATNVWLFYGAGPTFLSGGMNVIARQARAINGVGIVSGPHRYYDTQQVANEIMASPSSDKTVVVGYSCGGNAAAVIAQGFRGIRSIYVLGIQPSLWCGTYEVTDNVPLAQDTWSPCWLTLGLGCAKYHGAAKHIVLIQRPDLHLSGDDDPNAQRDVLSAIYAIANPSKSYRAINRLNRTTNFVRYNGQTVNLRERQ